jgi:hypothetical protein
VVADDGSGGDRDIGNNNGNVCSYTLSIAKGSICAIGGI